MSLPDTLPLCDAYFAWFLAGGLGIFAFGALCRSAKTAERLQFLGLCSCATGSLTVVKLLVKVGGLH